MEAGTGLGETTRPASWPRFSEVQVMEAGAGLGETA